MVDELHKPLIRYCMHGVTDGPEWGASFSMELVVSARRLCC